MAEAPGDSTEDAAVAAADDPAVAAAATGWY